MIYVTSPRPKKYKRIKCVRRTKVSKLTNQRGTRSLDELIVNCILSKCQNSIIELCHGVYECILGFATLNLGETEVFARKVSPLVVTNGVVCIRDTARHYVLLACSLLQPQRSFAVRAQLSFDLCRRHCNVTLICNIFQPFSQSPEIPLHRTFQQTV